MKRITISIPTLSDVKSLKDKISTKIQDIRIERAAMRNLDRMISAYRKAGYTGDLSFDMAMASVEAEIVTDMNTKAMDATSYSRKDN